MRRAVSVILFFVGGWIFASAITVAWMDIDRGAAMMLAVTAFVGLFSVPFLLLGMWASPGRRLSELGLTILIGAAIGGTLGLTMLLMHNDPGMSRLLPPGDKFLQTKFAPITGLVTSLLFAGAGWLLYRWRREPR